MWTHHNEHGLVNDTLEEGGIDMPRAKKTDDVTAEVEQAVEVQPTEGDFRQAAINLGLRICKDYEEGRVRPEAPLVSALTELFKAVKQ
jgi:hypothetical protein